MSAVTGIAPVADLLRVPTGIALRGPRVYVPR